MEVLLYCSAPCHVRLRLLEKRTGSRGLKHFVEKKHQLVYSMSSCGCKSFGVSIGNHSLVKNSNQTELAGSFHTIRNLRIAPPKAFNEGYSDYVIGREEVLADTLDIRDSVKRIMIPGLPDESNGEASAPISSCYWEWKPKLNVHYEKAGFENVKSPPLLFLPGFGVGSFHYEKQLRDLGRDYRVFALDFLGQGKSLPIEDPAPLSGDVRISKQKDSMWGFGDQTEPWAEALVYSVDLWRDQVLHFIEQVIGEPVYVVGNSLGGYVALYFAASYPQLVKGVTLLNATPFWGFLPNPIRSPLLARMFPWAGTFPLPANVRKVMEIIWLKVSDPETIADVLRQVYADHTINVDEVFWRIIETTQHPAAAAALASIMCAPTGQLSFKESLSRCRESKVPICLMYGKDDPWVKPIWGQQVKSQLPDAPYYEITPAGHCPHDEVPEVVNFLLRGWIQNLESQGSVALPLLDDAEAAEYDVTTDLEFRREGSKKSVTVHFCGSLSSFWNRIWSHIRAGVQDLAVKPQ